MHDNQMKEQKIFATQRRQSAKLMLSCAGEESTIMVPENQLDTSLNEHVSENTPGKNDTVSSPSSKYTKIDNQKGIDSKKTLAS